MNFHRIAVLITCDLAVLLLTILAAVYYGMSHLYFLVFGLLLFSLALHDNRTGQLSSVTARLFGFRVRQEKSRLNWLPVSLALILIGYSIPSLVKYGLVNMAERLTMQGGSFFRFSLWVTAFTVLIAVIAIASALFERQR